MKGAGTLAEGNAEKSLALNRIMEKYQPEGGYAKIAADDPLYEKAFSETAVFKITPDFMEVKNKMGQNLQPDVRKMLIAKLEERGTPIDIITAGEIRKTLP
jgi:hypothetical protein